MSKDEKMDRFNSKIASASEKNKLKEIKSRKVRPSSIDAITETLQAGDEAYDEVRRETRGAVPKNPFKSGGAVSSASKRADGCAVKGKTRGRMV
jgi:hypothetical protein